MPLGAQFRPELLECHWVLSEPELVNWVDPELLDSEITDLGTY